MYTQVRIRIILSEYIIILLLMFGWVINLSVVKNAVVQRFKNICNKRNIAANELANISGVTPSTVYSLFSNQRKNVSITTIKILCDGLNITLDEFFSLPEFDNLEQEIK